MTLTLRRTLAGLTVATIALLGSGAQAQIDYVFAFSGSLNPEDGATQLVLNGGSIVLNARARGWYDTNQSNASGNDTFVVGFQRSNEFRNFFVFDLAGIAAPITSARLRLLNTFAQFDTPRAWTYYNWDFTGDIGALESLAGNPGIFNDLGSGILYGATDVSNAPSQNRQFLNFDLNASALNRINQGGTFVVGGSLTQGNITAVPEPGEWAAMGILAAGLGGLVVRARRKRA